MATIQTLTDLSRLIDHTLLRGDATRKDIEDLCAEAIEHSFFSVCVNPVFVPLAAKLVASSKVKVATVCGFPLGANASAAKAFEAKTSIEDGAHEIDMVLSIGGLKEGQDEDVYRDIQSVKAQAKDTLLKVILEISLLTNSEIIRACEISQRAGADFVKTSTGFSTGGATVEAVRLMRQTVGSNVGVKASGGIRNLESAESMVSAGANRLGTSSGVQLMAELKKRLGS